MNQPIAPPATTSPGKWRPCQSGPNHWPPVSIGYQLHPPLVVILVRENGSQRERIDGVTRGETGVECRAATVPNPLFPSPSSGRARCVAALMTVSTIVVSI